MAPDIVTLEISKLIEDMEVYPRTHVDTQHINSLVMAIQSGAQLPPLIVDKRSLSIVDGWHRYRAYKRQYGVTAVVEVERRTYRSKAAMLSDAVALNSCHGRKLDAIDQARCVNMLRTARVAYKEIAILLHVPEARVQKLEVRVATVPPGTDGAITGTNQVAVKRPVAWMAGAKFSEAQAKVHEMLPGTSFLLVARQLKGAVEQRMIDPSDEKLLDELQALRVAIGEFLEALKNGPKS